MATNGEKFMKLTGTEQVIVSRHALDRLQQYGPRHVRAGLAGLLFRHSAYVPHDQLFRLGYRPGRVARRRRGERSWYFRLPLSGYELIAVLTQAPRAGEMVWTTTYAPDALTLRRRGTEPAAVAA